MFLGGFFLCRSNYDRKKYDRKKMLARRLYLFFSVIIFSGCNLNLLKNIASQTTVRFFSGRNVPTKSEPPPSARRLYLFFLVVIFSDCNLNPPEKMAGQTTRLYLVFPVIIFSGCNLNLLKNIAGQTTIRFFSGRNVPAKWEPPLITTWKKRSSHLWLLVGISPEKNYDRKKEKVQLSGRVGIRVKIRTLTMTRKNYDRKKRYSRLTYTICNTRNILFLLCLYLKGGNKLNVGIVCLKVKHLHKHI